jgi:ubiquinone/menaquinone biosynthesis C-methylase UbiE
MSSENGFFKRTDEHAEMVNGYPINPGWWSRCYEYPWAFGYAEEGLIVADMGCGWTPRPFMRALADCCEYTYAVDGDERLLDQEGQECLELLVGDFTREVWQIEAGSLDRVFCISVLEDVGEKVRKALDEFTRCLKVGGLAVLTFDVQYDLAKPLGRYPGVNLADFKHAVLPAGFAFRDQVQTDKMNAVYHEEFNLCCYHCVLQKL